MKKTVLPILILFFVFHCTYADINPNPIRIKGIVPFGHVSIQMISEVVNVELSKDSSIVTCTFYMQNLGRAQNIQIGFPVMNFYLSDYEMDKADTGKGVNAYMWKPEAYYLLNDKIRNKFDVSIDGNPVKSIDMYIPDKLKRMLKVSLKDAEKYYISIPNTSFKTSIPNINNDSLLNAYITQNKPWYLWKDHFKKGEKQTITVKYILPNGANHICPFFNYLLSTGAGWKGNIKRAQVIVNVKDIPMDQIVGISPRQYRIDDNVISWDFRNIKPTVKDDILINYENIKGSYKEAMDRARKVKLFVDDHEIHDPQFISKMDQTSIAVVSVLKTHPYEDGAFFIYTKSFVLNKFKLRVKAIDKKVWETISATSPKTFPKKYELKIDTQKSKNIFYDLREIDTSKIFKVNIVKGDRNKKTIVVTTK
jgi:hypothetical protein